MRPEIVTAVAKAAKLPFRGMIDASQALYAPFHKQAPFQGVEIARDQHYGLHERHRLDVFSEPRHSAKKPVLVYVHGGSFVGGDKSIAGGIYYDNVGVWAVRNGFVGVTMTYRRAPEATFPAGAEDISAALQWLDTEISNFGGDPDAIFLLGQSAGATHVATYIAQPPAALQAVRPVAGVVLLSGVYSFPVNDPATENARSYLGAAATNGVDLIPCFTAAAVPSIVSISELDPPQFHAQAKALIDALYEREARVPDVLYLPHHNHISQITHLGSEGTDDVVLSERLADFMRTHSV